MSNNGLFSAFLKVLVAAANPFAGGNSRLARSLRARAQPRDGEGRWVETGQGFSLNIGLPSGRVVDVATRSFGAGASKNTVQVYFPDGDAEIPAGFYEVPSRAGDASKGYIPGSASYVDKPGAIKDVVQLSSLQRKDAPDGWKLNEDGSYETLDGEFRIARNAERTGWTLSQGNEELKTEKELALAFKEASRLDVEGSSTEKSRKTIAKLRENVEQVRLREGVSEVEVQEAQRKLDRILFDDPDLSDEEKADRLELLDSAEAPEPEPEEPAPTVEPARPRAPRRPRTSGVPETVSTQAELDSLPAGTVVQQDFGIGERQNTRTWRKSEDGTWTEIVDGKEFPGRSGPRALDDKGMRDGSAPSLIRVVNPQISPALKSEQSKDAKAPTPPKDPNSLGESVTVKDGADNENMAKSRYSGPHYDKETKTFTPERQALHDRIIKQLLEKYGATAVAFAIQYMKGGGPGSGKSSLTDEMTGYNPNHIVIDPDEIKQLFPEVIEALERLRNGVGTKEDEEWAAESHEESSYLAKRLHRAAVERKLNVVVDGTGDSGLQSIKDKVDEARRNGYDRVVADYLYLEPEEGVRRAELRQKETFRRVPTEVIAGTYAKIAKIFPEILENNLFDEIRVYDNNVERGEAPKLIFEVKDGELVSLNEDGYDSFLKSASKAEKIVEAVENEKTLKTRNALRCRTKSVSTTFADDPDDKTCEILKDHEVLESERALLGRRLYKESVRLGPEPRPLTPEEQEILDEYLESTITKIQETALEEGGISFSPTEGKGAPEVGYMVSFPKVDGVEPLSKEEFEDPVNGPLAIRSLLVRGRELLNRGGYVGIWFDSDDTIYDDKGNVLGDKPEAERVPKYFLDISEYYTPDQLEEAKRVGSERNQIAIYDLKTKKDIPVGGTGERQKNDSDSTSGGDDGRGADDSSGEPVEAGDGDAEDGESEAKQKVAESADALERLYPELQSRESEVNRSLLSEKALKALDNLILYRQKTLDAMRLAAYSSDSDRESKFEFNYTVASRVAAAINELVDASVAGRPDKEVSFLSSSENLEARIQNMRIIPSSIKTAEGGDPNLPGDKKFISEADAIFISSQGVPYFMTWRNGSGVKTYQISEDGSVSNIQAASIDMGTSLGSGGSAYHLSTQEADKPVPVSVGMIKTNDAFREQGIANYMVVLARWASEKSRRIFEHSHHLLPLGNLYSKKVSKRLEYHHRSQREKFIYENYGKDAIPLFKAMDKLGWLSDRSLSFYGSTSNNFKGSHIIKDPITGKDKVNPAQLSWNNEGPLYHKFSALMFGFYNREREGLAHLVREAFHGKNAVPGEDYPAFFEKHVTGEKEDWSEFDIQTMLLRTVYKNGPSKEEVIQKLISQADELESWANNASVLNTPGDANYPSTFRNSQDTMKNKALQYAADARKLADSLRDVDFPEDERIDEPPAISADRFKFFDSPFEGNFTDFKVPEGVKPVEAGPTFRERVFNFANLSSAELADIPEWAKSENPALLAQNFTYEELAGALRTAIVNNKDGSMVSLTKDGFTQEFQGGAIYRAIENMGLQAPGILAEMYDSVSGLTENEDSYNAWKKKVRNAQSDLDKLQAELTGDMAEPTEFDNIEGTFSELFGVLFSGLERRKDVLDDSKLPPGQRLSPLSGSNAEYGFMGDGGSRVSLSRGAYLAQRSAQEWAILGISDNPRVMARNFNTEGLQSALLSSISSGKSSVRLRYPNNKIIDVPLEAVRDALQYQGVDTNDLLRSPSFSALRVRALVTTKLVDRQNVGGVVEHVIDIGSSRGNLVASVARTDALAPPRPPDASLVSLAMRSGGDDVVFADIKSFVSDSTGETLYRVRYAHPALVSRDGLDDSDDKNVREAVFETQSQAAANLHRVAVRDLFLQTSSIMPLQDMSSFGDRNPRETSSFREISVTENESASGNVPVRVRVLAFDELQARSLLIREFADGSARFAVQQITADGERFEIKVGAMETQSIDVGGSPREVFQTSTSRTELGQSNRGSRIFASRDAALDDISLSVATILGAPNQNLNRLGVDDSSTEEAQPTSAVFEGEVFTPSRDEVAGSGVVTLSDGQIGEFTSNLNLRKRPGYRIGAASPFVYADFTVSVGGSVLYKAKVSLTGRSTWTAQITDSQGAYLLSPKSVRNGSVDENASKALLLLKTELSSRFGLSSDDLQRMFPRGESVAGPTTEAPQKDAAEVVIPDGVATSSNAVRLNENIDGLDESGMLERVNEANSRFNDNRLNFSGNWGANDSASEIARKMQDSGYSNVEIDDYGRRVNFTTPSGISGSVRASGVGFDTSGLVQRRSLAHQIYNVLGVPSYSGGQISTPSGGLFAFDLPENTDLGGAVSQPLLLSEGNSPDTGAREEGLTWFNMDQDSADLQKARKDLQRSRVMQMLFGTEELFSSQVSHQMIRDENGDFRVALADGMFALDRTSGLDVRGHIEWLYSPEFRDALSSGNFDSVSAEKFGNTSPQELKELIEKHVVPFTPNVIRRVVGSYIGDSSEAEAVSSRLIDRRKQMLELFGVSDPSVAEAVAVVSTPDASASPTPESTPIPVPDLGEGTVLLSSSEFTLPNDERIAVAHYENELGALKVVYDSEGRQVARVEFVNAFNGDVRAKIYPGDVGSATDNGRAREVILSRDAFPDLTPEQIFSLAANWTSVEFSGRGDLGFKYLFDEGAESFADLPNFDTSYEELFISAGIVPARGANLNPAGSESRRTLQVLLDGRNVDEQKREMYQRAIDADDLNVNAVDVLYSRLTREPVRSSPAPKKGGDAVSSGSASDLDSQRNVNETRRVRVSDLKPGDYIAGNGEVLFVSSPLRRPYNEVNVHLVDANGQARIWQVDLNGIVPVLNVNPPEEFSGEPNPVVAFRNEGNKTLDDLKAEYPGHRVLPNGDVLLSQRDYQEKSRLRRTFRFEVVVHRTEAEEFVAYARRYEIDPATGEKIGPSESAALQAPAHSSVALINRSRDLINILKPEQDGGRKNPASWFSNKSPEPEIIDPRTGMPLPASLIPSRAEGEIPGTGINKTGDGLKDALISYISSLVDRGLPADSIIARLARQKDSEGNSMFSDDELVDLVDRVQFAKRFPLQPIPYLSRDGKTLIKPGDRVKHYDAQGNYLKSGTVMSRVGVKPYRKPNGTYEYRDLLLVKVDGGRTYELVARRLEVIGADEGGDGGSSGGSSDGSKPAEAPQQAGLTPAEEQERQNELDKIDPMSDVNDALETSETYEVSITPARYDAIMYSIASDLQPGQLWGDEAFGLGPKERLAMNRLQELLTALGGRRGKIKLTPREMWVLNSELTESFNYLEEAIRFGNADDEERAQYRALKGVRDPINLIRKNLGLTENPEKLRMARDRIENKYNKIVEQRQAKGGSSDAQAPTPARSPLAPPPPPTISEAPEVSDTVVRPDSIQVPQGYSFSTYGTDNGYLVTPDSNDERDKPSAIIAVDPFYRPGGVSSPVQVFVFAEDDDRLSGNSALIVQGFQNFEDAQQWMNARLDNDPRNIADVERAEEPFTPDGYVVKQDPSNPNGYIISLKDEENRDSAYRAYFYKDRHGLYVAELRKLGERFRKIRGDLTTVEQELERIMERPDAEPPAGFRSERDSVNGSTLFLPKNSDDLRSPSGQIFMEGRGDYRASLWFQEGSRKNNDDPDNTAQFVSYDEAKEWLSGELERMSTWSALPSNIEISEVTENTKSYRDPTSVNLGFAMVEQLNSEGTRFGVSFWNSEADAQSRLYRSPDENPDVFDSLADAEAYIAVKLGPRSESLDDFKDVIPYLSSNETALLKTYPDGEISDRALAMLRLKREVLTRGWSSREGFHGNTHIGDISFARLADGTEIVIKKFDSTEGRTYHQENAQTELMASRLFEALDIDSIVMTEFELDGLPAVVYIKQPGNIGRYSGISSVVDLLQYPEARNIALHDFLVNATDRHTGNWLYDDSTNNVRLYPIDHGHPYTMTEAGDTNLQDVLSYNQVPYGPKGLFKRMINRFVVANASPDPQARQDMSEFKDVFSRGELESANQKLLGLREMYESMGYGDYFENYILPRMNLLLGVAPS